MTFDATTLITFKGNFLVGVNTSRKFKVIDLVRLDKAIVAGIYDANYDMNFDGKLDESDVEIIKQIILENL